MSYELKMMKVRTQIRSSKKGLQMLFQLKWPQKNQQYQA